MLTSIYNTLKGFADFVQMEYSHVVSFFDFANDALGFVPKMITYIPSFLGSFVVAFVSICFVRRLINR